MKTVLLSHKINSLTPSYNNRGTFKINPIHSIEEGDTCNKVLITIDNHFGTHIDAPLHFCKHGRSISDFAPEFWISNCVYLLDCHPSKIFNCVKLIPPETEVLLLKTNFEKFRGTNEYINNQPIIEPEVADVLVDYLPKLRFLGFDMISLSSILNRHIGREAHKNFLCNKNVLIIEDMHLSEIYKSPKQIIISPLLIEGIDGAPCTVFAHVE